MDSVGRYTAITLAVILIILFPLQYIAQTQSESIDDIVCSKAAQFTDTARHQGCITLDMYEELINDLDGTGELYDIEIEASHPVSGKEIAENSPKDSLAGSGIREASVLSGAESHILHEDSFNLHSGNHFTNLLFENGMQNLNTGIIPLATHTHTDDCYAGDKHVHTGNSTSGGGCYGNFITDYLECGGTFVYDYYGNYGDMYSSCFGCGQSYSVSYQASVYKCTKDLSHTWGVYSFTYTCPRCGSSRSFSNSLPAKCTKQIPKVCGAAMHYTGYYQTQTTDQYHGSCGRNRMTYTYTYYRYECNGDPVHTKEIYARRDEYCYNCWYSNYTMIEFATPTKCTVASTRYEVNCGKTEGIYYNSSGRQISPTCNTVVTGITATNPFQTVKKGENIISTATATYLDGHTETVNCTVSGYNANTLGEQTVTLIYTGLVGNAKTNGTRTCTVNVNIVPPISMTYITVSPTSQSIQRYSNSAFTVRAYYDDGSSRIISSSYTITGLNVNILGTQTVTVSYAENNITKTALVSITVTKLTTTCPRCGTTYEMDETDLDRGCPNCSQKAVSISAVPVSLRLKKGDPLSVTVMATYQDGKTTPVTGWTSNYDPNSLGEQIVVISYQGLHTEITVHTVPAEVICPVCGNPYSLSDDGTDPGCPVCSNEVVSIDVLEESVTVLAYNPLNITVIATYKDGHTGAITDWKTDFIASSAGTFEVTIFYQSAKDNVIVRVIDNWTTLCLYCGNEYDRSKYPTGCPVCSTTVTGIEASLRYGGTQMRAGQPLALEIILLYRDMHRAFTYSGYTVTGYNANQPGHQTVTVHYGSMSTTLDIEVMDGPLMTTCPNGHGYSMNDDGTDPGCPYCDAEADKDTAVYYFDITYTSDILSRLYTEGQFSLRKGDYLTVTITQRDATVRSRMKKMFFMTNSGISRRKYTFGGEVS